MLILNILSVLHELYCTEHSCPLKAFKIFLCKMHKIKHVYLKQLLTQICFGTLKTGPISESFD